MTKNGDDVGNEWIERAMLFHAFWPSVVRIHCNACSAQWINPSFATSDVHFPPPHGADRASVNGIRPYCPACGVQMEAFEELVRKGLLVQSPTTDKPFVGRRRLVRDFLEQWAGRPARLWDYVMTHSYLTLKLNSTVDRSYALVVCMGTKAVLLPKTHWRSSLVLEPAGEEGYWSVVDRAAGVRIDCLQVGIFHQLTEL